MRQLVVNFHGIGEPPQEIPDDERPYWCPRDEWLSLADALADLHAERPLRITFDDGNASDVEEALPALLERGLTATFFVCAGRIGLPHYLDDEALHHLRSHGMRIGSHGWDHIDLRTLDAAQLRHETEGSRERLAEHGVDEFALPFGSYDRRVLRSLEPYRHVHTSDGGATRDGWLVPRTSYVRGWTADGLTRLVTEQPPAWKVAMRQGKTLLKSLR